MSEKEKITYKKYPAHMRSKVYGRALALMEKGLSYTQIAIEMDKEGLRRPDGSRFDTATAERCCWSAVEWKKRSQGAGQSEASAPSKVSKLPPTCLGILTDPNLSDAQKVKMLIAYEEA